MALSWILLVFCWSVKKGDGSEEDGVEHLERLEISGVFLNIFF
jgi:hypothetical protein